MRRAVHPAARAGRERQRSSGRAALGLDPVAMPLFEIEPVDWDAPDPAGFDGLLLTSANAVRHGGDGLERFAALPVYAVGEATAAAAREAGFDDRQRSATAMSTQLLGSIAADLRLLHLCGEDRRTPAGARQTITPVPVYRAAARSTPADARRARRQGRAGPFAARRRSGSPSWSPTSARAIRDRRDQRSGGRRVRRRAGQARRASPSARATTRLLALAARLCDKPRQ